MNALNLKKTAKNADKINVKYESTELIEKRKKKRARIKLLKSLLLAVWLGLFSLLFLFPTIFTMANSFTSESEISANYGVIFESDESGNKRFMSERVNLKLIPDMVTFKQYSTVLFKSPEYLLKFWNAVILVLPIVIFQVLLACFASYGFARYRGKWRELLFFGYIVLMFMPYQVTIVPNFLVSKFLGIIETRWAVILPGIFSPFAVYYLTKSLRRVPESVIEAAKLDGANEWQICTRVCLPTCKGSIYSVVMLVFIDYWNMVEQFLTLLTDREKQPLSVFLSEINTGEISLAFAVAVIYMIPPLLLFLHGEEYLVEGIASSGSVKG